MVKLTRTGRFVAGRTGLIQITKDGRYQVESDRVKEVWINSGGSFDVSPLISSGQTEAFKLPSAERKDLLDEGYRLWKYDALGGTIVSLTTFFVLGRGVVFQFADDKAQFYAKKFYRKNNLEMRIRSACDESVAFGEVFMWLRPKFSDVMRDGKKLWNRGDTQVTFIQPENVTNIETAEEDPTDVFNYTYEFLNAERKIGIIFIPDISKYDIDGEHKDVGCMIHIKFNAGNMDPFGHSDLIRVKEWLDNYQEYLRDGVIINKLYRSPCFDISIEDGTTEEVNAAISRYRAWTIGSNPVHNAREKWQILEFTGPNTSSENARRALLLIIAAGVGFAEYMLADGSNANLASSKSQQLPVIKKFEDRQDIFAYYLMKVFQFVLLAKARAGNASGLILDLDPEGDPEQFEGKVEFPAIAQETDTEVASTNQMAIANGYMSPRTAAQRLGLDYEQEVSILLSDQEKVKKLKAAGINIVIGVPEQPEKNDAATDPKSKEGETKAQSK